MKFFIFKIFFFLAIPILSYIGIAAIVRIIFINKIDNYPTIILGDSQTEFIRSPEIFNRSILGSPYYVHYEFVKEYIEQVKGKKVYIAYNYHNLSKLYQNRLANDNLMPGWRANTFQTLNEYHLFNHKYLTIRPENSEYSFFDIKRIPRLFKDFYQSKSRKNSLNSTIDDTLSIGVTIQRHWNNSDYILSDSIQRTYLNKLMLLLKQNNCDVILLKMPLTNFYINNVPNKIKKEYDQLANNYKVKLLNLNDTFKISKDYIYFKDYGHLNLKGDSLVNKYFEKLEVENEFP